MKVMFDFTNVVVNGLVFCFFEGSGGSAPEITLTVILQSLLWNGLTH